MSYLYCQHPEFQSYIHQVSFALKRSQSIPSFVRSQRDPLTDTGDMAFISEHSRSDRPGTIRSVEWLMSSLTNRSTNHSGSYMSCVGTQKFSQGKRQDQLWGNIPGTDKWVFVGATSSIY